MKYHLKTDISKPPKPFLHKGVYYIRRRLFIDGKHKDVWRSLHTDELKEAQIAAYRLWYNDQGKSAQELLDKPRRKISSIYDDYQNTERYKLLADSSKRTISCNWGAFLDYCEQHSRVYFDELNKEFCLKFLDRNEVKNKTFNNVLNDMKQIFKQFCINVQAANPFDGIEQKSITRGEKASDSFRAFTNDEIKIILHDLPLSRMNNKMEWFYASQIAMYTGLRYIDIAFLRWTDISANFITLAPSKTERKTAGRKVIIKISDKLKPIIAQIPKSAKIKDGSAAWYVFPNLQKRYSPVDGTKPFSEFLKQRGIVAINNQIAGFHSFRATFITKAKAQGIDTKSLGGIVGHSSEKQTEVYNKNAENIDLSAINYD